MRTKEINIFEFHKDQGYKKLLTLEKVEKENFKSFSLAIKELEESMEKEAKI